MCPRISTYIGAALIVAVLAFAEYFFLSQKHAAPISNTFASNAANSAPATSTSNSAQPPPNTKAYQSVEYHFLLYYPDDLTVTEQPLAGNSIVVLFEDQATVQGFDIFITPDNDPKITQARFLMDEPSGIMNDPQNITIDGAAATEFFSTNSAMGASREIWFIHAGFLYEVTAPQPLDSWLLQIMQTWHFT